MAEALPTHIGLVLDGNRRWAKQRGLIVMEGHREGYEVLKKVLDHALERGIQYVSAYVFSTENWKRTPAEVTFLMDLTIKMFMRDLQELHKKNVRLVWLGSPLRVSKKIREAFAQAEALTKGNTQATLAICFNYGGHQEIVEGVQRMIRDGIDAESVNDELVAQYMYHPEVPPIDLLIRTSGEQRLSNFMLWRAAYSELLFIDKHWPDFTPSDFDDALETYAQRGRRYGG